MWHFIPAEPAERLRGPDLNGEPRRIFGWTASTGRCDEKD
jgi:hypothetical protein